MRILLVDDQESARLALAGILSKLDGAEIVEASNLNEARRRLLDGPCFDVALIDLRLGSESTSRDGLTLVGEIREKTATVPIVVTPSKEAAELRVAMRLGAYDFILKDDLCDELVLPVLSGIGTHRRVEREGRELRARPLAKAPSPNLVGASRVMETLRQVILRVALSDRPALITGPTGSGKELVVGAVHALGLHPDEPLLDLNCSAIPEALMESQLFGHERGAFTGADRRQDGYLTLVRQGTLFLDEIAELPLALQSKLLRVLETGRFRPVGSPTERHFTGRVIAATHANLKERVASGRFREDLFYRLNVLNLRVPALSERPEDIPALLAHFCGGQSRPLRFSAEALDTLKAMPWPGNVRELRNLVDRLAAFSSDDLITADIVRPFLIEPGSGNFPGSRTDLAQMAREILQLPIENKLAAMEEALVSEAVALSHGNKSAAARLLGVHRKTLERRAHDMDKNGQR